jgi:hypothetical protein
MLLMLLLATDCCTAPQEQGALAPVTACPVPIVLPKSAPAPEVAALTRDYAATETPTIKAVIAPDATPESVSEVHRADIAARRSLDALQREGAHPTPAKLQSARAALHALHATLATLPTHE